MGDLDKIIDLHALMNDCSVHDGSIDSRVGADLDIILYDNFSQLRDFLIASILGGETESVGSYNSSGMNNTVVANGALFVDGRMWINDAVFSDCDIIPNIGLWIDLGSFTNFHAISNVSQVPNITILADCSGWADPCG